MCFSPSSSLVILDVCSHAGVATPSRVGSSLQRWILWRRVGTDRGPTGHVLADKGTVLGELATFINTNKNSSVRTGSGWTDGRFCRCFATDFLRSFIGQQTHIARAHKLFKENKLQFISSKKLKLVRFDKFFNKKENTS